MCITLEHPFASLLPITYMVFQIANLTVHPAVSRVVLHGSRGLAGGYRSDSDIDLSLIVDVSPEMSQPDREQLLRDVWDTTCDHWQSSVELDLALIFDVEGCGLPCFDHTQWDESTCTAGGVDCFGLFKLHKGFTGLVTNVGIRVQRMYPCLTIWRRT
ncbi:MAG: nucleotidyltransferase domain-containing protein [Anaerolineae bacterium]|nr:nucleotidyltransferase domain-containing protein [Anaerolineae bacterium]